MASSSSSAVTQRGTDLTSALRELVQQQDVAQKSQRKWEKRRDDALGPILSAAFVERTLAREVRGKGKSGGGDAGDAPTQREKDCMRLRRADAEWIGEAVKIQRAIASISDFLQAIRRPYLSAGSGGEAASRRRAVAAGEKESTGASLDSWRGVSTLTDKERDEIEFQVKMTIKRCLSRIKELEEGESVRKRTTLGLSANPFSRLLGSASTSSFPGRSHPLYAEQLSQHRAAITQYLSNKLAQTNARMGDLQEARLKAQRMKRINLAGSAAVSSSVNGGDRKADPVAGSVRQAGPSKPGAANGTSTVPIDEMTYQSDFSSSQLTAEQLQEFDKESNALVQSLSDDLRAVEAAERKLSEISELQTQLIQHLGSQAEVADNLLQEAVGHTLEVGKGNEQLRRAKENNRQANKFLCYFLIGSGLGLLFLHFMD